MDIQFTVYLFYLKDLLAELLGSKQNAADLYGALHGTIEVPETEPKQERKSRAEPLV